jgi:uncharacterized protein YkwD
MFGCRRRSIALVCLTFLLGSASGCTGTVESDAFYDSLENPGDKDAGLFDMSTSNNTSGADQGSSNTTPSPTTPPITPRDMGPNGGQDMDVEPPADDMDSQPVDPCQSITCGQNATCSQGACQCDAGFEGDPQAGCTPPDPCDGVMCGTNASCREGACLCPPGFSGDPNNACQPESPGDIALRSENEVCSKWKAERSPRAASAWARQPADDCDTGELHAEFLDDAIRRLNLYRWLVGLGPVVLAANANNITQHCATTMAAANVFTHYLDESHQCYTPEAGQGAGSSNIASGVGSAADSVDLYIFDRGVASLGHRRWCFNPRMGRTGFGWRGRYSCMYSFDQSSGGSTPEYVAYPAPGFFPTAALGGEWSFASSTYSFTSNVAVQITRLSDMSAVAVSNVERKSGNYGSMAIIGFSPNRSDVSAAGEYEVVITGLKQGGADTSVAYRVNLTSCP